ncbi:unnamed protein product, partial [Brachionus calyciflorus]
MPAQSDSNMPVIISDKSEIRRCVINLWTTYNGLGLILKHNRVKDYPVNLVRQVELGSPAHYAGVQPNDLIIKVNTRLVEFEKFDLVLKLIKDQLKKDKRVDLLLINSEFYDEFKRKYAKNNKIDYSNPSILSQVKNYQSPLFNPNTPFQLNSNYDGQPRLCHLLTWPKYDGYGFYVAYTNDGCYVKNVEPNSPAQLGGLRDYDRIIEIDNKAITNSSDKNTIMKLINKRKLLNLSTVNSKSSHLTSKSSTSLHNSYLDVFVCDPNTFKYLKDHKINISTKNKSLKIQECFTPTEFELNEKLNESNNNLSQKSSNPNSISSNPILKKILIKRCTVRRLKGREDQPLGFEMTKRGNNPNFISRIEPDTSAHLSGLEQDDFIIELNEKNVEKDDNSLLKEKIFKYLENDSQFKFTTLNRQGYEYCSENGIKLNDLIESNLHNIKYFETPLELSSLPAQITPPQQTLPVLGVPRLCVIQKTHDNDELGISIARYKNYTEHIISDVIEGSLAHKAGIKQNDCLLEVNGENVENKTHAETIKLIADLKRQPNARISLLVVEKNNLKNLPLPNQSQNEDKITKNTPSINVYPEIKICEFIGYPKKTQLGLVITSDDYSHDVIKVTEDSPAFKAGLAKGDVILSVNDQSVENNPNSIELLNDFSETKPLKVLAASRYAYEWSKLLKIKINEKDWPNIKKFVTRNLNENLANISNKNHQHYVQSSSIKQNKKYLSSMANNSTIRSEYSNLARSAVDITADGKVLRLCTLILDPLSPNPTDSEFGFDLVTKISANRKIGDYFIDTVDMYSPACQSGLKPGDRLVEVDGLDVSTRTFEQVVQIINEAKQKCKLKLLVLPSMIINYGNQNMIPELREIEHVSTDQFNQTYTSMDTARSLPDLTDNYSKNFKKFNNDYDSIYHKKNNLFSKSTTSVVHPESNILRPVPRLCTIYKQESNIGFGVQNKNLNQIIPNYMRVSLVNYKSPAYLSGLEAGDYIVEINGRNTLTMSQD